MITPLGRGAGAGVPFQFAWRVVGSHLYVSGPTLMTLTRNTDSASQPSGGAVANASLPGDGSISFVAGSTIKEANVGFGTGEAPIGTYHPRYCMVANDNGLLLAIDGGILSASLGAYAVNDVVSVNRAGAVITGQLNGVVKYTFTVPVVGVLRAAAHVETNGYSVVTSQTGFASEPFVNAWPTWQPGVDAVVDNHSLWRATNGPAWDVAGYARSVERIASGNAGSLSNVDATNMISSSYPTIFGLMNSAAAATFTSWDFGVYTVAGAGNTVDFNVIELGTIKYTLTGNRAGDVFTINVAANGTVTYLVNGVVKYTSLVSATGKNLYAQWHSYNSGGNPITWSAPYLGGIWS